MIVQVAGHNGSPDVSYSNHPRLLEVWGDNRLEQARLFGQKRVARLT
jgi:hypothetical protein